MVSGMSSPILLAVAEGSGRYRPVDAVLQVGGGKVAVDGGLDEMLELRRRVLLGGRLRGEGEDARGTRCGDVGIDLPADGTERTRRADGAGIAGGVGDGQLGAMPDHRDRLHPDVF